MLAAWHIFSYHNGELRVYHELVWLFLIVMFFAAIGR